MKHCRRIVPAWVFAVLIAFVAPLALSCKGPAQQPAAPPATTKAAAAVAIEKPFLWRIELPTPSYLFGTIHLPDERVTTLPAVVVDVVDQVDALYTEIPTDLPSMMKAAARVQLPKGTKLVDVVGEQPYARLRAFAEKKGLKVEMFERWQPWAIAAQLPLLDHLQDLATKQALDAQLAAGAKKAGKQVGALETLDEQLDVFGDLTNAEQATFLGAALDTAEKDAAAGKDTLEELIQTYLRGDEQAVAKEINDFEMGDAKLQKKLMRRLVDDRNLRMVDRIVRHLQEQPDKSAMFAVGAAHYPGEVGILNLLQKRGYRITRIDLSTGDVAAARDRAAIEAEIAAREADLAKLRARREHVQPAGAGR